MFSFRCGPTSTRFPHASRQDEGARGKMYRFQLLLSSHFSKRGKSYRRSPNRFRRDILVHVGSLIQWSLCSQGGIHDIIRLCKLRTRPAPTAPICVSNYKYLRSRSSDDIEGTAGTHGVYLCATRVSHRLNCVDPLRSRPIPESTETPNDDIHRTSDDDYFLCEHSLEHREMMDTPTFASLLIDFEI